MGWLRELMVGSRPTYRSFDALARAALTRPDWPTDAKTQPRSLAAILGKLDRERDLDWLGSRPRVQAVLAELLRCPVGDLRVVVDRPRASPATERRIRLRDVPAARALDVLEEPLPPGIPDRILDVGTWRRLWWWAPSGSGRTLAGRWLEARGRARFVQRRNVHEPLPEPGGGPLFVELEDATGIEQWPLGDRNEAICVAAPARPPKELDFEIVRSPPVDEFLDRLLGWLAARLPNDDRFDPVLAAQWLRRVAVPEGAVDTLGAVLGLSGLIDELGQRELRGRTLTELGRIELRGRVDRIAGGATDVSWLRRSGFDVLVGLMRRISTDSDQAWDVPRRFDEWLELVPDEYQRGPDFDWLKLSLPSATSAVRADDLEKAARRIPPGAFRILRTLQAAEVLRQNGGDDGLQLGPRWLGLLAAARARDSLVEGSPFEWGEALLRAHAAPGIARAVYRRVMSDESLVDQVIELEARDSPAHVAALECTVRAAGMTLLEGGELAHEQLEELWDEQLSLLLELRDGQPLPRIDYATELSNLEPLLESGSWLLALLALSESLPRNAGRPHLLLRPWSAAHAPKELRGLYDRILAAVETAPPGTLWARQAFFLADRLRHAVGGVTKDGAGAHPLEQPGIIQEEAEHGVLGWDAVVGLERSRHALGALEAMSERRGTGFARVAQAIWAAWQEAGAPESALVFSTSETGKRLQIFLPPELLEALMLRADNQPDRIDFGLLGEEHWQRFVELAVSAPLSPAALRVMPAEHLTKALSTHPLGSVDRTSLAELWQRAPDAVLAAAEKLASDAEPARALALLVSAPAEHVRRADERLRALATTRELAPDVRDELKRVLYERIRLRGRGFRDAFGLLFELERREPHRLG